VDPWIWKWRYDDKHQVIEAKRWLAHPKYDGTKTQTADQYKYDIGLIELEQPVTSARAAKLADSLEFPAANSICKLAGWGLKKGGIPTNIAHSLELRVLNSSECREHHSLIDQTMQFCTINDSLEKYTAVGDSGSCLYCLDEAKEWVVGGIVSFAYASRPWISSGNIRLTAHRQWIDQIVNKDSISIHLFSFVTMLMTWLFEIITQ
ncbi:mast cell protease, partial [Cichlidogyrus casuarinus]